MEKDSTTPFVSRPRKMSETVIKARKREMDRREAVLDAEIEASARSSATTISRETSGRRRLFRWCPTWLNPL